MSGIEYKVTLELKGVSAMSDESTAQFINNL